MVCIGGCLLLIDGEFVKPEALSVLHSDGTIKIVISWFEVVVWNLANVGVPTLEQRVEFLGRGV